jgi:pimeloyl-ACP methyl ester carboxylesterase
MMDDAGIEHAHLFGNSEGRPMTLLFAAAYPDRGRLGARLSVQLSGVRRVLGCGVIADRDRVRLDLDEGVQLAGGSSEEATASR